MLAQFLLTCCKLPILTSFSLTDKNIPTGRFYSILYRQNYMRTMQQRGEETRTKIIDAAIRLFSKTGYNKASVDDICKKAGISKGAFYHHFKSKQELFLAILDNWLKAIDNSIEASKDMTVPETFMQIAEAFPYFFETADAGLPMFLEFWTQASRDKKIWDATIAPYRRYHKYFTTLIEKGVEEGSFVEVDPELASRMIVSTAMGMFLQSLLDPKGAKWEKVARDSTNMLVNSLLKK